MLSASDLGNKANRFDFYTEINGGWVKEGEVKITPMYGVCTIGAKTPSCKEHCCVRNMIGLRYRKMFHTADFVFFDGGKFAGINLLQPLSYTDAP